MTTKNTKSKQINIRLETGEHDAIQAWANDINGIRKQEFPDGFDITLTSVIRAAVIQYIKRPISVGSVNNLYGGK